MVKVRDGRAEGIAVRKNKNLLSSRTFIRPWLSIGYIQTCVLGRSGYGKSTG